MKNSANKSWEKTKVQNLVRHKSGRYYARTFGNNKEIWKSLRTDHFSVAKARLAEFLQEHREKQAAVTNHSSANDARREKERESRNRHGNLLTMNEAISQEQLAAMKELAATMAQVMEGKTPEPSMGELMNSFPKPSKIQRAILAEIRKACARKEWSGLTEMLAILGSWGDTLGEEDVLRYLRDVTRSGTMMAEVFEQSLLRV